MFSSNKTSKNKVIIALVYVSDIFQPEKSTLILPHDTNLNRYKKRLLFPI